MTRLLIPPALGFGLRPGPCPTSPSPTLPTLALTSAPFGAEAVAVRTVARPGMPAHGRSVHVVLTSPFAGR